MDRVELTNLFDIYESLLTDREKEIFKYYYYEDLSLSEISENLNITRTGVFNTLKKVEEKLLQYEDNLKLMSIKGTLKSLLEESDIEVIKNKLNKII
ncbi:MAG: sigma factor-like helix-turn-helix DNA-binding protein [Bacilli bacterium]|nr:sigma factor-like helix-turn-helix DNA-binding protein [Bacilli bacterium]